MVFEDTEEEDDRFLDWREDINCKTYTIDQLNQNGTHDFSLFHTNIRSLNKHHAELDSLLTKANYTFDIVACSETWLSDQSYNNILNINGYNLLVKNRSFSSGGGVCLYVKSNLSVNICDDLVLDDGFSDSLFIEINTMNAKKLVIGVIYRPPSSNPDIFRLKLEEILYNINNRNSDCILLGDFNIDLARAVVLKLWYAYHQWYASSL